MHPDPFSLVPISRHIWETKYRLAEPDGAARDVTIDDTWQRVARAAASVETGSERAAWTGRFAEAMADFAFVPAGRIIAGAGSGRQVTLFNCFVMGAIGDDLGSIFDHVREAALTMQQGGGIGHDFSTLRPRGAPVSTLGADASGPVSFMDVWDAMCRTIMSAGARRGAMMGTLRCDHPDIELFIDAKSESARLRNFNVSVLVTDAFIAAVREDRDWNLQFGGRIFRTLRARELWERIMHATYSYAEPGVIFIDRVNAENNLAYCETISCTNPCGEQPLPPYGACLLGSINLARLVRTPFGANADIDTAALEELVRTAVRLLDNVIDVSGYPLDAQRAEAVAKRRIGLGVTGLADALMMCGLRYDTPEAVARSGAWMKTIQNAAYLASSEIAHQKASFPLCDADKLLARPNLARLDTPTREAIRKNGLRNGCLTSIAPTGTISMLAGNVSSGIEPVFGFTYDRRILAADGSTRTEQVEDYAHALYRTRSSANNPAPESQRASGEARQDRPASFVTAQELTPAAHVEMQAALQPWVDSSISKTINCPANLPFDDFKSIYLDAFDKGLKGCTTYRPNPITGAVLSESSDSAPTAGPGPTTESPTHPVTIASSGVVPTQVTSTRDSDRVVFMTKPLEREPALAGFTYKLKWPGSPDAIYVTINDIERDGRPCPFEIFINTKNLDHYAWTVALTRMISAVFRRGGDVSFVVEELKAIFDPQGGRWIDGRYVPSLLAAIGEVIERHMVRTGFMHANGSKTAEEAKLSTSSAAFATAANRLDNPAPQGRACPQCGRRGMRRTEGCWVCPDCSFSQCN